MYGGAVSPSITIVELELERFMQYSPAFNIDDGLPSYETEERGHPEPEEDIDAARHEERTVRTRNNDHARSEERITPSRTRQERERPQRAAAGAGIQRLDPTFVLLQGLAFRLIGSRLPSRASTPTSMTRA